MKSLTVPLVLAAAATLAACGNLREFRPAPAAYAPPTETVTTADAPRPGVGKVMFITDTYGPVDGVSTQTLTLRMDDGTTQVIEQRGRQVALGEHLQITSDNRIRTASR